MSPAAGAHTAPSESNLSGVSFQLSLSLYRRAAVILRVSFSADAGDCQLFSHSRSEECERRDFPPSSLCSDESERSFRQLTCTCLFHFPAESAAAGRSPTSCASRVISLAAARAVRSPGPSTTALSASLRSFIKQVADLVFFQVVSSNRLCWYPLCV